MWTSRSAGSVGLIAAGSMFFAATAALAAFDVRVHAMPLGSPRAVGWLLVILTASFVPLLAISGTWHGDSLVMLPAVLGTMSSWIVVPWLCWAGPQPRTREGRFTPVLLAWMGLALNAVLSAY